MNWWMFCLWDYLWLLCICCLMPSVKGCWCSLYTCLSFALWLTSIERIHRANMTVKFTSQKETIIWFNPHASLVINRLMYHPCNYLQPIFVRIFCLEMILFVNRSIIIIENLFLMWILVSYCIIRLTATNAIFK